MSDLTFSVDSALLSELGEKIVESVHVALVELVKNSYDADATEVVIKFTPTSTKKGPEIRVSDDGNGMSLEDIQRFWMRIATTNKRDESRSPLYGRPRTGAKGIGRFCCRRLGTNLSLITTGRNTKGEMERTEVTFPWLKFVRGSDVTQIKCEGTTSAASESKSGTTLIISGGVADEWEQRGFDYLKRQLAVLSANRGIKRKGYLPDPGFTVILDAAGFRGGIGDLREQTIEAGWGTISGKVDDDGQANYTLDALNIGQKTISREARFLHLRGVEFKIGIIVPIREDLRDPSVLSKGSMSEILEDWGGVQVRYNGFRVYPYGDDDWLDIDKDRSLRKGPVRGQLEVFSAKLRGIDPSRVLLSLLSMRNYLGQVEIGPESSGFEMKASREGFIHSDAYSELKDFVRFGIDWATIYRDFYLRNKVKSAADEALKDLSSTLIKDVDRKTVVEKALNYIQKEARNLSAFLPPKERKSLERNLVSATTAILTNEKANQEELLHLRLVASTSTLLLIFAHEVKSLLGMLQATSTGLELLEKKASASTAKALAAMRHEMLDSKSRFAELLEMTALIGVDSRKKAPQSLIIADRAERAARCFQLVTNSYKIEIDCSGVPKNLTVGPMLEAELLAILLNVISNSIKSVIAAGGDKRISISAERSTKTVILIRDTGIGIHPKYREEVFIPFVSDPDGRLYSGLKKRLNSEDNHIIGSGSGLGLSIIREIVNARNGSVHFAKPQLPWKSEIRIELPK